VLICLQISTRCAAGRVAFREFADHCGSNIRLPRILFLFDLETP